MKKSVSPKGDNRDDFKKQLMSSMKVKTTVEESEVPENFDEIRKTFENDKIMEGLAECMVKTSSRYIIFGKKHENIIAMSKTDQEIGEFHRERHGKHTSLIRLEGVFAANFLRNVGDHRGQEYIDNELYGKNKHYSTDKPLSFEGNLVHEGVVMWYYVDIALHTLTEADISVDTNCPFLSQHMYGTGGRIRLDIKE